MEILNTVIFYILTAICALSALFCLFQKNIFNSVISAAVLFAGLSGYCFLLNAPLAGVVQILISAGAIIVLMLFSVNTTNQDSEQKYGFLFNLKTLFTPIIAAVFAFLVIPFILYQFKGYKTVQNFLPLDFAINLYKNNALAFELTGILIFTALIGTAAVITIKNTHKSNNSDTQKGENN